jgi:Ran GTPase-activating protein (RanGAP) involved in mRNA processing and transport
MNMNRRDALAQDINLEDITSSKENAEVLRKLRDGGFYGDNTLCIDEYYDGYDDDDCNNLFVIEEGDDLSWLGYFIGRSRTLNELNIKFMPEERERIDAFIDGVSHNRSLWKFSVDPDGDIEISIQNLCPFFRENNNLTDIYLYNCDIGRECARDVALALSQRRIKNLRCLGLAHNNLGGEGFADIAHALHTHPQFDFLYCKNNNVGRTGCVALGAVMREELANLTKLHLDNNAIDDAGLQALIPGLCNNNNLEHLTISDQITAAGLRALSPFLQSDSCSLIVLSVRDMRFGDEEAAALAGALTGNKSLQTMYLPDLGNRNITETGWSTFSKLLCDTSSINNTYLSNHTLTHLGVPIYFDDTPRDVTDLLQMNAAAQKNNIRSQDIVVQCLARCKILMSHPDLDMEPFMAHRLKFLPLVMNWFRKGIQLRGLGVGEWKESVPEMQSRELSAVYKFVRGMPLLVSDGYWTNVLKDSQAEKRKLQQMLQRAEENEKCALKRLRR